MGVATALPTATPTRSRAIRFEATTSLAALYIAANVAIGLGLGLVPQFRPIHFATVVLVSVWAAFGAKRIEHTIWVTSYVAGCDVLWRVTRTTAPWEYSKYFLIGTMSVALLRHVRRVRRPGQPVIFIALLLPSVSVSLLTLPLAEARTQLAGNLAGPVALAITVLLFRQVVASRDELRAILLVAMGPPLSVWAVTAWGTLTADEIAFGVGSNFQTSGGFGPNQVSTALGFGVMMALLLFLSTRVHRQRLLLAGVGLALLWQAFVTFSRGGVYAAGISTACMAVAALTTRQQRVRGVAALVVIVLLGGVAYSSVNSFSGGSLSARYADTEGSNREAFAARDLELFMEYPLFGTGPGVSRLKRDDNKEVANSHTEVTRLLAEHGIFGLLAAVFLVAMAVTGYRQSVSGFNRLLSAAMLSFAVATSFHSSTRLALVSFAFGLGNLRVRDDPASARRSSSTPPRSARPI
jgi:hypothetical protein